MPGEIGQRYERVTRFAVSGDEMRKSVRNRKRGVDVGEVGGDAPDLACAAAAVFS